MIFLTLLTIHDDFFSEEGIQASFDQAFDTVEPSRFGAAIDALIRDIYRELTETIGNDVGLYFITELKQHLGDSFVDELRGYGVYFERIQSEQHLRSQTKRTSLVTPTTSDKRTGRTTVYLGYCVDMEV